MTLPKSQKVMVPPIKTQGIKTKLMPFILESIEWDGRGRFIEPFLGSGVVAFNVAPERALLGDTNKHIIKFYQGIQSGEITPDKARQHLYAEGDILRVEGKEHYYRIRERFNEEAGSLDFLFLTRSCFNGLMRFNSKGGFNVPFCHKPDRFR